MPTSPDQDTLDMVLDVFTQEQQAELVARFGEGGYAVWRDAPDRTRLANPGAVGAVTGACGDTISIALAIDGDCIMQTDFDTDGCASSCIAAATAAALARGKTLDEAVDINEQAIVAAVERFPDDERHCAYLAAAAVRQAVHQWMIQSGGLTMEAGEAEEAAGRSPNA